MIKEQFQKLKSKIITMKTPANEKMLKKMFIASGFVYIGITTSLIFILNGVNILIRSGVPEKTIIQGFGVLFVLCGFVCAKNIIPATRKLMSN